MNPFKLLILAGTVATTASAESIEFQPAVSALNGKVDYAGGVMESDGGHNFSGSITVPVGAKFGFQADALYTRVSDRDFFGGAGHFFWRDPSFGLLGIAGGAITQDAVSSSQALVEGQYYAGKFTVSGHVGVGHLSYDVPAPFIDSDPTEFTGSVSLDYYVTGNLRLGASYTHAFGNHLGVAQAEYQTPWKGLALTAEYARGSHSYDHVLFGIRFYFGKNKPLIDRHRQDDPPSLTQRILTGIGLYGAEFNRRAAFYVDENGGQGGWSGSGHYGYNSENPVVPFPPDPPPTTENPTSATTGITAVESTVLVEVQRITRPPYFPPLPPAPVWPNP